MRKGLTDIIFVLDKSGSMYSLAEDTIGGFNSMLDKQKNEEGTAVVTTILFNDRIDVIHDRFNLEDVRKMDSRQYVPNGSTALLDALGTAIQKEISIQKNLPEDSRAEHVIFVIMTDGMENSSCEYSYRDIRKMIKTEQDRYGWEFLFLGANIDAAEEGDRLGIRRDRTTQYVADAAGTALNYHVVSEAVASFRGGGSIKAGWDDEIRKDIKNRGRHK